MADKLPLTVLIAVRNEEANILKCLHALGSVRRVVVIDSHSQDRTTELAKQWGAEVVQFHYQGGYPKKRQWALDTLNIDTPWVLLLDADEVVPEALWNEISSAVSKPDGPDAYLITKGFHFLGRRFRFGGFSFAAVLLIRKKKARFERLFDDPPDSLDMEVHERIAVDGRIARLKTPLIHEDFKGLEAYLDRHNKYSTWESRVRYQFEKTGNWGTESIRPRLFGNIQEQRRWLKFLILRLPCEHAIWFFYHYILRLGFLERRPGLIACQIRSQYISNIRAKVFALRQQENAAPMDEASEE